MSSQHLSPNVEEKLAQPMRNELLCFERDFKERDFIPWVDSRTLTVEPLSNDSGLTFSKMIRISRVNT